MKKKSVAIVFFGNERLATGVTTNVSTLKALIKAGYDIKAVVSNYNHLPSRSHRDLEIAVVAKNNAIPLLLPPKIANIKNELMNFKAQVAVLVAYGQLIPENIINIFPKGVINVHPSLLPKYRGSTPIEQAILDGTSISGVSLMKLVKKMDAGPIIRQQQITLNNYETKQNLADQLLSLGGKLLVESLPSIIDGDVKVVNQDDAKATFCSNLSKDSGYIDWNKTAVQLEREIRAFLNWPKSQTAFGDINVIITKVRVLNEHGEAGKIISSKERLIICCGDQALDIIELKPAGKAEMDAKSFLAGYKARII